MIKTAVVSKNQKLSELCRLELLSFDIKADITDDMPRDISQYSLIVLDVDTVEFRMQEEEYPIIALSKDKRKLFSLPGRYLALLEYPFLLRDLRSAISRYESTGEIYDKNIGGSGRSSFSVNPARREIELLGYRILLSEHEFSLLSRLCETPGKAVSREELSRLIEASEGGNMADVYICRLRKKLERASKEKIIYTVRGEGYMTRYSMSEEDK